MKKNPKAFTSRSSDQDHLAGVDQKQAPACDHAIAVASAHTCRDAKTTCSYDGGLGQVPHAHQHKGLAAMHPCHG
eukprot:m.30874 g.30874  ORF g.30874 m.30874 type:complete len:75 (+) comp10649_c0_seq1:184-408(+)